MAGRLFPAGGRSIVLTKFVMVIGRAAECDIHLNDVIVSGRHCALIFDGAGWAVEDLKSKNGIWVNDQPVAKRLLKSGDTLTVSRKYRFVIEYDLKVERERFSGLTESAEIILRGDDRKYAEHGPATKRLEPDEKDVWSKFK